MPRLLRHLPWIVATAAAVSCLAALASRDADWMRMAGAFSLATVLFVLRDTFWPEFSAAGQLRTLAENREGNATAGAAGGHGGLRILQQITEIVWPQSELHSLASRFFVHLTWITAAVTVVCWLAAMVTGDDEWTMAAVGFSFGTFVLVLATAFPGRFTAAQRLMAGVAVVVGLIIIGLLVLQAALSGWPK